MIRRSKPCSVISPRALLSAGHCVEDYERGTLELHFGPSLEQPGDAGPAGVLHRGK